MLQSFVSKLFFKKNLPKILVPPLWEKREKKLLIFLIYLLTRLRAAQLVLSRRKLSRG